MDFGFLIFTLLSMPFGLWLASQKNFVIIPNQKYNTFLIRMIFAVPYSIYTIFFLATLLNKWYFSKNNFSDDINVLFWCLVAIGLNVFLFLLRHYQIFGKNSAEIMSDFDNYPFYRFRPITFDIKKPCEFARQTKNGSSEACISSNNISGQNLSSDKSKIEYFADLSVFEKASAKAKQNLLSCSNGDIVLRKDAADTLMKYDFSGYSLKEIAEKPESNHVSPMPYFLLCSDIFKRSSESENFRDFYEVDKISQGQAAADKKSKITEKELIVSKKVMKMFISEFGYGKRDFQPIDLINDRENKKENNST